MMCLVEERQTLEMGMSILGKRIRLLRSEASLTQEEFGKLFGVSKSTVSLYESGNSTPDDTIKGAICDYFNVTMDYLLGRSDVRHHVVTRAAHATGDLSKEELEKVEEYIKFIKSQRGGK